MLFRGIVKSYAADLIFRTKFKKIIGMKEQCEYQFHLWSSYSKHEEALVGFFVWSFTFDDVFSGNRTFKALFFIFSW